jgi:hypothetical protein
MLWEAIKFGEKLPFRSKIPQQNFTNAVHQQSKLVSHQQQLWCNVKPLNTYMFDHFQFFLEIVVHEFVGFCPNLLV